MKNLIICTLIIIIFFNSVFSQDEAGVAKVEALHQDGKTYIVFEKKTKEKINYLIYRFTALPTSIGETRPIAKVTSSSFMHPDNFTCFVMPDGKKLTDSHGLFVYTAKAKEQVYYAVMAEGKKDNLEVGKNILEKPIDEMPCEKHIPVFQAQKQSGSQLEDYYALWLDYDQWEMFTNPGKWPKNENEVYVSFFSITYFKEDVSEKKPVVISLHAISGGGNGGYYALNAIKGQYRIYVSDHRKRWWKGSAENRINTQIDYLLNSNKYNIDKDRVYLEGICMGGSGAIYHGIKYSDKYAAVCAFVPSINQEDFSGITKDSVLPPILTYFGYRDGDQSNLPLGRKGHIPYIKKMQENIQGIWVTWFDEGHAVPKNITPEKILSSGYIRFRKNELHPVFINTSGDDNCGHKAEGILSFAGQINQKIDWASSLHPFDNNKSELIDKTDELGITFKATEPLTTDIGFRRLQNFIVAPGKKITFKVVEIQNGATTVEGEMVMPADKQLIFKRIPITTSGTRLQAKILQ